MVVVMASVCSAVICILLMVLLLSPLGLLRHMWTDPAGLGQQFLFQLLVAGLAAGFAVSYLRHAVKLRWSNGKQKGLLLVVVEGFVLFRERADFTKLIHGVLAACLVGLLTHVITVHDRNKRIDAAKSGLETVRASFDQNQGWLSQRAKAERGAVASGQPTAREASLLPADLIGINCKLRDMHAALHVFDVSEEYFQLDPDFAKAPADGSATGGASRSTRDTASIARCPALKAKDATITTQIDQLKDICSKLNRVGIIRTIQATPSIAGPDGSSPAQGQRIIVPTLFLASEKCELNRFTTDDPNEKDFKGLGNSLSEFFYALDSLSKSSSGTGGRAVVFPMISAFFIAYMFGAGARVWRAWWLNNEAGQQEMRKLREQIESISGYSIQPEAYETWLSTPLGFLNYVAPKEAVRYEGLKARLYAKIENGQIEFGAIDASAAVKTGAVVGGEPALSHR